MWWCTRTGSNPMHSAFYRGFQCVNTLLLPETVKSDLVIRTISVKAVPLCHALWRYFHWLSFSSEYSPNWWRGILYQQFDLLIWLWGRFCAAIIVAGRLIRFVWPFLKVQKYQQHRVISTARQSPCCCCMAIIWSRNNCSLSWKLDRLIYNPCTSAHPAIVFLPGWSKSGIFTGGFDGCASGPVRTRRIIELPFRRALFQIHHNRIWSNRSLFFIVFPLYFLQTSNKTCIRFDRMCFRLYEEYRNFPPESIHRWYMLLKTVL